MFCVETQSDLKAFQSDWNKLLSCSQREKFNHPEDYEILRDLRERAGRAFRPLHMAYRPQRESPLLTSDERRKVERLLNASAMNPERSDLEAMLAAGRIGRFEQESLGVPLPGWPFYSVEQQANVA